MSGEEEHETEATEDAERSKYDRALTGKQGFLLNLKRSFLVRAGERRGGGKEVEGKEGKREGERERSRRRPEKPFQSAAFGVTLPANLPEES